MAQNGETEKFEERESAEERKSISNSDEPPPEVNQENKTNILRSALTESAEDAEEDRGIGGDFFRVSYRNSGGDDAISFRAPERRSASKEGSPRMNRNTDLLDPRGRGSIDRTLERRGSAEVADRQGGGPVARNLNDAFAASAAAAASVAFTASAVSVALAPHDAADRRPNLNGAKQNEEKKDASRVSSRPRKIYRTRSLEKPRESLTVEIRERKYSLDDRQNLSTHASFPVPKPRPKSSNHGGDISEGDEDGEHSVPEGAVSSNGTLGKELNMPSELTASSRSVNEIEYNSSGPGVHRLHGSSPDLGSMYVGGSSPLRDADATGPGQPGKETDLNESPRDLSGSHLGSDLSASYGRNASGHCSENESRGGSETSRDSSNNRIAGKKKKTTNWYNHGRPPLQSQDARSTLATYMLALSPTYKSRSMDFRKLFKDIPTDERLIVDYSCALQKDILVHGRLYLTQNWVCFYANIFRWETILTIKCKDICSMTKEKTARVIPNAITICTREEKYFFTSFGTRDKTYMMLFRVWQNALMDQPMSTQELWQWVHQMYGDELGLTSSDDDYVAPPALEDYPLSLENSVNPHDIKDGEEDSSMALNGESISPSIASLEKHASNSNLSLIASSPEVSAATNSHLTTPPVSMSEQLQKAVTPDATSNDIPTDAGDTTEDSDGLQSEIICGEHNHEGFLALDEIFQFSVEQIFDLLFTESEFNTEFIKSRKTFDLVMAPWPDEPDADGTKSRIITYTLSLNYSFGPKVSPSTEKQTILPTSRPGEIFVIDTEVVNGGVPYGENFYVVNRFCITRISGQKSRLRVHCAIKYRSKIWGLAKTFIEKNAKEGLLENYHLMAECLRREQEKLAYTIGQPGAARKKVLRRRRTHNSPQGDISPSVRRRADSLRQHSQPGTPTRGPRRVEKLTVSQETLIKIVCFVLILLMAVNAMLYYKLWALEGIANNVKYSHREFIAPPKTPLSPGDWAQLLDQQQTLHQEEIRRWKEILAASVQLVDHMKSTLSELYESLDKRSAMDTG